MQKNREAWFLTIHCTNEIQFISELYSSFILRSW